MTLAVIAVFGAVLLATPAHPRLPTTRRPGGGQRPRGSWRRPVLSALAGIGAAVFVGGSYALVVGLVAGSGCWWWIGTVEPAALRNARAAVRRDLPTVVHLLAAALRSGAAPAEAVRIACASLPGPAAERLHGIAHRLALGSDPATVWQTLATDDALAPLGRCLARAAETGAPVVAAVERLAVDLEAEHRQLAEAHARSVGVKAAVPLGLCLLPSFLLLGIVPLAVSLLSGITA